MIAALSTPSQNQQSDFARRIEQEFITGSAISPALFAAATEIHADLEIDGAGDPVTPIHDALNWTYTRFSHQAKDPLEAIILLNEDDSPWQAKLSRHRIDRAKTRQRFKQALGFSAKAVDDSFKDLADHLPELVAHQKYETPKGNGSKPFLPPVPADIRQQIASHYGAEIPLESSFWDWLAAHPEIPFTLTEGGKKGLSLLSHETIGIALYGVNGGYRSKDKLGNPIEPELIPELERFCQSGRKITLAFDQDPDPKTQRRVANALSRFGGLLAARGCVVYITLWDSSLGKGVDDLIVNHGADAWEMACLKALSLEEWRLWRALDNRLTLTPAISLKTNDLQSLQPASIPDAGVIAIASAKGTGKTKLIANTLSLSGDSPVLLAGHRIALMRNLCSRMGVDYRGDLDKVQGEFIAEGGYTLRVGFVVDSLLAINPEKFRGCDLVIDEVVQVLRHLLTSSTCNKDGKRPALIARLHQLIQVARRVIIADADLNNAAIHYIQELRAEGARVFLIRNDFQSKGFPVRFMEASDASAITAELLLDLEAGEQTLVATDSKAGSKHLERLISQIESFGHGVLVINSDTSGGELEQGFMANPARFLAEHPEIRAVITTPSMATGVSIECEYFTKVYGLFWGVSSTDADMSQALSRERRPIPRVVWCARVGRNFSKVSRDTNQLKLRQALKDKTSYTVSLIRSSLREDIVNDLARYDWQNDPHLRLWAEIEVERNRSMHSLRAALKVRLMHEGNQVEVVSLDSNAYARELLKAAKEEVKVAYAKAVEAGDNLDPLRYKRLKDKESLSPAEQLAIAKYEIAEFYHCPVDQVSEALVLADRQGRTRGEVLNLEAQIQPETTVSQDAKALEKQAKWGQGYCPWDIKHTELRRRTRSFIGLDAFLDPDLERTKYDYETFGAQAREAKLQVKIALNFTITDDMSNIQIAHQLLSQMGIKMIFRTSRSVPGHEGEKLRLYRIDPEGWQNLHDLIQVRQLAREKGGDPAHAPVSPLPLIEENLTGETGQSPDSGEEFASEIEIPETERDVLSKETQISLWNASMTG